MLHVEEQWAFIFFAMLLLFSNCDAESARLFGDLPRSVGQLMWTWLEPS